MTGELLYGGAYFKRKSIYLSQMHPLLITFSEIEKKKKKKGDIVGAFWVKASLFGFNLS